MTFPSHIPAAGSPAMPGVLIKPMTPVKPIIHNCSPDQVSCCVSVSMSPILTEYLALKKLPGIRPLHLPEKYVDIPL